VNRPRLDGSYRPIVVHGVRMYAGHLADTLDGQGVVHAGHGPDLAFTQPYGYPFYTDALLSPSCSLGSSTPLGVDRGVTRFPR